MVDSQARCDFNKSILKSPRIRICFFKGATLSIISTKRERERERVGVGRGEMAKERGALRHDET
jgi:hypothetical protein